MSGWPAAREGVVAGMIGQQAGLIGIAGFVLALGISQFLFPLFPRRVVQFEDGRLVEGRRQ